MLLKRFQKLLIVVFKTLFKTQYSRQITNTNRTNINRNELPFVSERSHRPTLNHFLSNSGTTPLHRSISQRFLIYLHQILQNSYQIKKFQNLILQIKEKSGTLSNILSSYLNKILSFHFLTS